MDLKLNKDGLLIEKLTDGYTHSTEQPFEDVVEDESGQKFVVTGIETRYYLGDRVSVTHIEELSREPKVEAVPTVESVISENAHIVELVTSLRAKATPLIKDLPIKNATQREYALTVALTNEEFTKEFLQLPEKYKDLIIL